MEACYYDSLGVHTLTVEFLCCWLFLFILDCCIQHYQVVDQYLHSGFVIRAWRTVTVASNFQLSHKKKKKYSNVWSMNFIRLFCHSTSEFRTAATVECIKGLDTLHFSVHWLPCECGRQETQAHANSTVFQSSSLVNCGELCFVNWYHSMYTFTFWIYYIYYM